MGTIFLVAQKSASLHSPLFSSLKKVSWGWELKEGWQPKTKKKGGANKKKSGGNKTNSFWGDNFENIHEPDQHKAHGLQDGKQRFKGCAVGEVVA